MNVRGKQAGQEMFLPGMRLSWLLGYGDHWVQDRNMSFSTLHEQHLQQQLCQWNLSELCWGYIVQKTNPGFKLKQSMLWLFYSDSE
jgi:hypothetical protein